MSLLSDDEQYRIQIFTSEIVNLAREFGDNKLHSYQLANKVEAMLLAEIAELRKDADNIPAVLFDGYAVYQELTKAEEKRTSYENVSDVLDAVVRILRRDIAAMQQTDKEVKG